MEFSKPILSDKRKAILSRIRSAINSKISEDSIIQKKVSSQNVQSNHPGNKKTNFKMDKSLTSEDVHIQEKFSSQIDITFVKNEEDMTKNSSNEEKYTDEVIRPTLDNEREDIIESTSSQDDKLKIADAFSQSNPIQMTENTIKVKLDEVLTDTVLNELSEFLNEIRSFAMSDEVFVDIGFWDFAGQRHYYPTHPIFLNPNAVHLLVADIMKDLKQINTEEGYNKIGGYVDFWLDSVHSCSDMENKTDNSKLNPPVIVVATKMDSCKYNLEERKKEFCRQLMSMLDGEEKKKHLRDICWVSNTEPSDEDFDYLRKSILEFGKELNIFGQQLPLRWIRLELALEIIREANVNILSWVDLINLSSECSVDNVDEIELFLKYQHNIGTIIYFESLKEYIILNQKWLADAFKCLVSDKIDNRIVLTSEWKNLEDTGKLELGLIEKLFKKEPKLQFDKHRSHLLGVMELFGIILKPKTLLKEDKSRAYQPTICPA